MPISTHFPRWFPAIGASPLRPSPHPVHLCYQNWHLSLKTMITICVNVNDCTHQPLLCLHSLFAPKHESKTTPTIRTFTDSVPSLPWRLPHPTPLRETSRSAGVMMKILEVAEFSWICLDKLGYKIVCYIIKTSWYFCWYTVFCAWIHDNIMIIGIFMLTLAIGLYTHSRRSCSFTQATPRQFLERAISATINCSLHLYKGTANVIIFMGQFCPHAYYFLNEWMYVIFSDGNWYRSEHDWVM